MEGVAVITVVPAGVLTPPIEDTGPPRVALDGGVAAVGIWGGGGVGLSSISSSEERGGVGGSPATPCVTWGGEGLGALAVTVASTPEEGVASLSSLFILMRSVEKMVENLEEGKDDDEMLEEITLEIRSKVFSADGEKMGYIYVGTGHWVCL